MDYNFNILALFEADSIEPVVVFPGRFHPFHKGHKSIYESLKSQYPNSKVVIATSDKTNDTDSPFTFEEKKQMMILAGIPADAIMEVKTSPYNIEEYINALDIDEDTNSLYLAVSQKDMDGPDARFQFPTTGLAMTAKGKEKALQRLPAEEKDIRPVGDKASRRAYVITLDTKPFNVAGFSVKSASEIRNILGGDVDTAKQAFVDLYDKYNEEVFNLIRTKLAKEEQMEQIDLKRMRQLAGINEDEYTVDTGSLPSDDAEFGPGFKEKSVYDQLGKIIDSESIKDVVDADKYKPVQHIKTDDGDDIKVSVPEAMALRSLLHIIQKPQPKEKFLAKLQSTVGFGELKDLVHSKGVVAKFEGELEEANNPDGYHHTSNEPFIDPDGPQDEGEYSYTLEYNGERNGYTVHKLSITSPEGETKEVADDFTYFETEEQDIQAELESWFHKGHGVGDEVEEGEVAEQNKFAKKVQDLKAKGMPKGTKFKLDGEDEEYTLEQYVQEGGNAFDIAMTDCVGVINNCESEEQCVEDLGALMFTNPEGMDEKYANEVIQDYITMVQQKGLEGAREDVRDIDEAEEAPMDRYLRHMAPINKARENNRCPDCGRMEKDCTCPGHDHNEDLDRIKELAGLTSEAEVGTGDISRIRDKVGINNISMALNALEKMVAGDFTKLAPAERQEGSALVKALSDVVAEPNSAKRFMELLPGQPAEAEPKKTKVLDFNSKINESVVMEDDVEIDPVHDMGTMKKVAIGHVDNERDMIRRQLYQTGKYCVELFKMLGDLPDSDFPNWWQAKVTKAGTYMSSAKHYLENSLEVPAIDDANYKLELDIEDEDPSGVS
jgi:cytidyltransferase-like protein